jgi:superfamily II RNA helicase
LPGRGPLLPSTPRGGHAPAGPLPPLADRRESRPRHPILDTLVPDPEPDRLSAVEVSVAEFERSRGFRLFPFQREAVTAIESGRSVIVSAPTGAGKTVVAEFAIERALRLGRRLIYTSPIKALSNQKFRDFQGRYGDRIGIMTGDVTIEPEAPVLIMTTEIFRNTIFEDASKVRRVEFVVMDEIHYIADTERGTVWEESLLFAPPEIRFVGLSATISNIEEFRAWIEKVRGRPVDLLKTSERPVPLRHLAYVPGVGAVRISEVRRHLETRRRAPPRGRDPGILDHLETQDLLPALYFCFSRRECESRARAARRRRLLSAAGQSRILREFDGLCDRYGVEAEQASELRDLAARGILYHHAGLLPSFKDIVERLFASGLVRLLFATETFALGVNMPARSVVFASLRKFDGVAFDYLTTLDYYQMAGRAGRQGIDTEGHVFTIVDPAVDTAKAVKDVVFGKVAPIQSRFNLSYSAVLNLYATVGDGIFETADRSFASYQRKGRSGRHRALLKARLSVLDRHGYRQAAGLTGKGRFAARLAAYEIQLTELFWDGCFEALGPDDCAVLVSAIVYEARRGDFHQRFDEGGHRHVWNRARKRVQEFRNSERAAGLEDTIRELDFGLAAALKAWMGGCTLDELRHFTSGQDGDVVRHFRMVLQMLRQFGQAVSGDRTLADRVREAMARIDRDEVDAERQLRAG